MHGIPTDGTTQLKIRFDKTAFENPEQAKFISELFVTTKLQVTKTFRTMAGTIVVRVRTSDVDAVEVAEAILRG